MSFRLLHHLPPNLNRQLNKSDTFSNSKYIEEKYNCLCDSIGRLIPSTVGPPLDFDESGGHVCYSMSQTSIPSRGKYPVH